ncbi:hypothetical protein [Pseudooceanicola sp.]|nr:hypothetical protein [Pseudooceanicola sp.]MDF1853922.1 hypothetical protein [Pseudooceanicola sp.]
MNKDKAGAASPARTGHRRKNFDEVFCLDATARALASRNGFRENRL